MICSRPSGNGERSLGRMGIVTGGWGGSKRVGFTKRGRLRRWGFGSPVGPARHRFRNGPSEGLNAGRIAGWIEPLLRNAGLRGTGSVKDRFREGPIL